MFTEYSMSKFPCITSFNPLVNLWIKYYYYLYYTDEEPEA